jgi:hypothetical protein
MKVEIEKSVLEGVFKYLLRMPCGEVFNFIAPLATALKQEPATQPAAAPAKVKSKDKPKDSAAIEAAKAALKKQLEDAGAEE